MSALTDRIAEVLREHWRLHDNRCRCDKSRKVLTGAEWRAHVAERIAEAVREVGFVRTDGTRAARVYTDADAEAWVDGNEETS